MWHQHSYHKTDHGVLYLVPTPIGNLEDMTFRAVRMLKEADLIAAEDTRQTKKLSNHFDISTPLISHHEHNVEKSTEKVLEKLEQGQTVAVVTDAGMPGISDPGYDLTIACLQREIPVIPLPGANAALPALVSSGIDSTHFYFYGFLPRKKKEKQKELERTKQVKETLIFYEAPHRLKNTLQDIENQWGSRQIAVVRELTKKYEEIIRGKIGEVRQSLENRSLKGEFCLIVEGAGESEQEGDHWWEEVTIHDHVDHYITIRKMTSKEAIKQTAKDRNVPKREVYQTFHTNETK